MRSLRGPVIPSQALFHRAQRDMKIQTRYTDMNEIYQQAIDKYTHYASAEDLKEAVRLFEQSGEAGAEKYVRKCNTLIEYMVGNTVTFGSYQNKPIRWKVLDERGRMRMLFAESPVACRPYHDTPTDTSWQACSLRKWLNGEFLEAAFTPEERSKITAVRVENPRSPKYYTNGGLNTMDRAYVLSVPEAEKYLPDEADRALGGWWWLRTPGSNLFSAVAVYDDGSLYEFGIHVHYENGGVRPVVWVLLK